MKKIFLFAATAALLTACSSEELTGVETAQQKAGEAPINFSVYTPRSITRAGVAGTTDNGNIGERGIGIMAYYTDDEVYNKETSKPNYMYNTKLSNAGAGAGWVYNPVMYWPNEFGDKAISDNTDYVSFFAYAPYIDVENTTGIPELKEFTSDADYDAVAANLKYKYAVPTYADPTSIGDLAAYTALRTTQGQTYTDATDWAGEVQAEAEAYFGTTFADVAALVAYINALPADDAHLINGATDKQVTTLETYKEYTGLGDDAAKAALEDISKKLIQGKNITEINSNTASGDPIVKYVVDTDPATSVDLLWGVAANTTSYNPIVANTNVQNNAGLPFVNLIKPKDPVAGKMSLRMLHALSRLNVNIKYISDKVTNPDGGSEVINADETRIYVRSIKIGGFIMKAALNLNNTEEKTINVGGEDIDFGIPNWKAFDGKTALTSSEVVKFLDGRKDGKEGMESGADKNEDPTGLNPLILENYTKGNWGDVLWTAEKNPGVTNEPANLFGNGYSAAADPIFVIPTGDPIDIEIVYDVMTKDDNLSTFLSDGLTHGNIITNTISKTSKEIFGADTNMEPGNAYTIKIILGMTSVKFDASVEPWNTVPAVNVNLPDNQ